MPLFSARSNTAFSQIFYLKKTSSMEMDMWRLEPFFPPGVYVPPFFLSSQLLAIALLGLYASWRIPAIKPMAPHLKIRLSWLKEIRHLSRYSRKDHHVFRSIICISWFWFIGTILLSELPPFARDVIIVEESVFIFLLLLFTIGIGVGSLVCNVIFKGNITTKATPLLALAMAPL